MMSDSLMQGWKKVLALPSLAQSCERRVWQGRSGRKRGQRKGRGGSFVSEHSLCVRSIGPFTTAGAVARMPGRPITCALACSYARG
jgi:hypothetical protein